LYKHPVSPFSPMWGTTILTILTLINSRCLNKVWRFLLSTILNWTNTLQVFCNTLYEINLKCNFFFWNVTWKN
jgi:hypothetical protein